jgi:3-hydroxy acid dehydrogenase/malonic semialdehyde reductase
LNELSDFSSNIKPYQLDISNKKEVENFLEFLNNEPVSILINCAGGGGGPYFNNILQEESEYLENAFKLNTASTFNLTKSLVPFMKSSINPLIINITSISAHEIFPSSSSYTIAKHSESVLTKILRRDLLPLGIRVTEMIPNSVNSHEDPLQSTAIKPEDVAEVVNFICHLRETVNINSISLGHVKELPFLS